MNDDPKSKFLDITKSHLSLWSRAVGFLHRQRELRIEDILKAAKKGKLDQLLTSYYTIYTDPLWQEKIQLCMDLKEAGLLQADFRTDLDKTTPVFLDGEPRITIAGREHLLRTEQSKLWRRSLGWTLAFFLGLLSSFAIKWLDILIDLFAKKHGLK